MLSLTPTYSIWEILFLLFLQKPKKLVMSKEVVALFDSSSEMRSRGIYQTSRFVFGVIFWLKVSAIVILTTICIQIFNQVYLQILIFFVGFAFLLFVIAFHQLFLMFADTADTNIMLLTNNMLQRNQQAEENEKLAQALDELKEQSEKTNELLYHIYLNTDKEIENS
jgi:hypothetical protein